MREATQHESTSETRWESKAQGMKPPKSIHFTQPPQGKEWNWMINGAEWTKGAFVVFISFHFTKLSEIELKLNGNEANVNGVLFSLPLFIHSFFIQLHEMNWSLNELDWARENSIITV